MARSKTATEAAPGAADDGDYEPSETPNTPWPPEGFFPDDVHLHWLGSHADYYNRNQPPDPEPEPPDPEPEPEPPEPPDPEPEPEPPDPEPEPEPEPEKDVI